MAAKFIILDRDGVINYDSAEYIKSEQEWTAIPGSLRAIGSLYRSGYRVAVITNQAGLARGKFNIENLNAIHRKMNAHLAQYGGVIEAIFYCPHGPEDDCACRKPRPGMFMDLSNRLGISLEGVLAVGDKLTDIEAAQSAGATPVLVRTGHGRELVESNRVPEDISVYDNLAALADALLAER
jgi:D-glycero-D-manno-heptose 1,7-bisphosphate phosphatase